MNEELSILLVCAQGASTSILLESMKKDLHEDEDWMIEARGYIEVQHALAKYDLILIAPQMAYAKESIVADTEAYDDITVMNIPADILASADGHALNEMVRNLRSPKENSEGEKNMSEVNAKKGFMQTLSDWMEAHLVPIGMKISNQRHLAAVRDGLAIMIPATIVGGFAMLLAVPPIPASITEGSNFFYAFLLAWKAFAAANSEILLIPYYMTIGIISIYVVCGVSYTLANNYKMNALNNMISALLVYLTVSGAVDLSTGSLTIANLGAGYMFSAMVIGLLVVEINRFFINHNIVIKMPSSVPPNVAAPFNVLLPLAFSVIVFSLINALLVSLTGAGLASLVYTIFQPLMRATGSLPSVLLINILMTTFWFFGIHGANMLSVVTSPITTAALAANAEAYVANEPLPYIYAGAMNSVFGNWITYLVILLCIFLFCKSSQVRGVAKVAIVPAMFNINEPTIFGLPTVLNVYTYIPLLICSMLNTSVYYLLASANVVGRFYLTLPFTVPGPLQAFLATGDAKTILLWVALFLIDIPIVAPFIKTYDNTLLKQEQESTEE